MNVVFLAFGATRRAAVVAESARVVDAGGTVTVLLDRADAWADSSFPGEVKVLELPELEQRYRPQAVSRWLYRVPKRLFGVCAPGRLGDRLWRAFRWRVTLPLDRKLAQRYRSDPAEVRRKAIHQAVVGGTFPDLVVVSDPQSLSPAAQLVAKGRARRLEVAFYGPVSGRIGYARAGAAGPSG